MLRRLLLGGSASLFILPGCGSSPEPEQKTVATVQSTGPLMRPGDNCLRCHSEGAKEGAPPWSAAGTVYESPDAPREAGIGGVSVILTDVSGKEVRLVTNEVGNFYTAEVLQRPLAVALERSGRRIEMPFAPPAGSCNACHSVPAVGNAPGRMFAP